MMPTLLLATAAALVVSTPTPAPTATVAPTAQPTPVPQPSPTVSVPASLEQTQVPVMLQGADNVGSLEFVLTYDATVLEAELVEPGSA